MTPRFTPASAGESEICSSFSAWVCMSDVPKQTESRRIPRAELSAFAGGTLPDLIPKPTRLLFAGINPGLRSVAVQAHFAPRGNRFYPALFAAGITDRLIDASSGFTDEDLAHLEARGIGITCIVPDATARASELSVRQLREGALRLRAEVAEIRPRVLALLGITAYRTAFQHPDAQVGRQSDWGDTEVWVAPNPSGLNRHYSVTDLAAAYGEVADRAGITRTPP